MLAPKDVINPPLDGSDGSFFWHGEIIQTGLAGAAQSPPNSTPPKLPPMMLSLQTDCGTALNVTRILVHGHVR